MAHTLVEFVTFSPTYRKKATCPSYMYRPSEIRIFIVRGIVASGALGGGGVGVWFPPKMMH